MGLDALKVSCNSSAELTMLGEFSENFNDIFFNNFLRIFLIFFEEFFLAYIFFLNFSPSLFEFFWFLNKKITSLDFYYYFFKLSEFFSIFLQIFYHNFILDSNFNFPRVFHFFCCFSKFSCNIWFFHDFLVFLILSNFSWFFNLSLNYLRISIFNNFPRVIPIFHDY